MTGCDYWFVVKGQRGIDRCYKVQPSCASSLETVLSVSAARREAHRKRTRGSCRAAALPEPPIKEPPTCH